jgi:hypothetical protein
MRPISAASIIVLHMDRRTVEASVRQRNAPKGLADRPRGMRSGAPDVGPGATARLSRTVANAPAAAMSSRTRGLPLELA